MQQIYLEEIKTHIYRNKIRQIFRKFVQFLCCVVVFCTTYALILPAITMEQTVFCGFEEHTHSEECYPDVQVLKLVCSQESLQVHVHDASCYGPDAGLICGQADYVVHAHNESCMMDDQLVCSLPERAAHVHGEACYIPGETEPEVLHMHTDSCYELQKGELICSLEEYEGHTHSEECYVAGETLECILAENHLHQESCFVYPLVCTISTDPHIHSGDCYGTGDRLCTIEENHVHGDSCSITCLTCESTEEGHEHGDGCYTTEVVCTVPENHSHDSSCYATVILCGKAEGECHEHGADCYSTEPQLNCTLVENHVHDDSCYLQELVCTVPEDPGHAHGDDCYQWERVLNCGMEEGQPEPTEPAEPVLVCTEPVAQEHVHGESCFVTVETDLLPTCGIEDETHVHTDGCYDCPLEEHAHTLACYSDPEADVESAAVWESTFAHVALTGDWPTDVVAIAESQIGYTESSRNYEVWEDNSIHGYTRYGAWYGVPYGDWCGMFASFCLDYAGVEGMPYNYGVRPWIEDLASRGLYYSARETKAQKGNLIFFDWEGDGLSDHVGIVAEVQEAQEHTGASIKAIEGNASNCVKYVYYSPDDPVILGYGLLPGQERIPLEAPSDEVPEDSALNILICGTPGHVHGDSCYDEEGTLICEKQEHLHSISCVDPSSPVGHASAGQMLRLMSTRVTPRLSGEVTDITPLLINILIYDSQDNVVYNSADSTVGTGQVKLGENCRIKLFFKESEQIQFASGADDVLTYTIPSNLVSEIVGTGVIVNDEDDSVVANYTINNNQLTITPVVPDGEEVNFFGKFGDAHIDIEFDAEVLQTSGSEGTDIDFSDKFEVDIKVVDEGYLNLEKELISYDPDTREIYYKCKATAQGGTVQLETVSDWDWGIEDDKLSIVSNSLILTDTNGNNINHLWNITTDDTEYITAHPKNPFYLKHNESITMTYKIKIDDSVDYNFDHSNEFYVYGNNGKGPIEIKKLIETPIRFTNVKKDGILKTEVVDGHTVNVLRWSVTIENDQLEELTMKDQLSAGQTFCKHQDIVLEAFKPDGSADYFTITWNDVTQDDTNTWFEYELPEGYSSYKMNYYSHYVFDPTGDNFQTFENTVTTNTTDGNDPNTGTGNVGVTGIPPGIDKTITGFDENGIDFKIECFMPGALYNRNNVLLYDMLASWGNEEKYFLQEPLNLTLTVTPQNGTPYTLQPYSGGSTENTYLLVEHGLDYTIYFNTSQANNETSVWKCASDSTLTITYRLSLDTPTLEGWGGNPTDETMREFLDRTGQEITNYGTLVYSYEDEVEDEVKWKPPRDPDPFLRKNASPTDDDGVYNYSVWLSSGEEKDCIFRREENGSVNIQSFEFKDEFDSRMNYVEGSLRVSVWSYWDHSYLIQRYKLNNKEPSIVPAGDGKKRMTVSAADLIGYEGSNEWNWLNGWSLLDSFEHLNAGYQYEFTYQLEVDGEIKNTTTEGVLRLENTAYVNWVDNVGPREVEPAHNFVNYNTGILQKSMTEVENRNVVNFTVKVNPNALNLTGIENGSYVLYDTMSSNLTLMYNTLVVEVLNKDSETVAQKLTLEECKFSYDPDQNQMIFNLPDEKVIRLTYSCRVSGNGEDTTQISNVVELHGRSTMQDFVNTEFEIKDHQGSAGGSNTKLKFHLQKQDGNNHNTLAGVTFHLYGAIVNDSDRPSITVNDKVLYYYGSYTTGPDGIAVISHDLLTAGYLYALVEESPPSGYVALSEPYVFYMENPPEGMTTDIDIVFNEAIQVVKNYPMGYRLPETGGSGRELYTFGGWLLMLAALILLYNQKKCRKEDYRSS